MNPIYLDYAASTPVNSRVLAKFNEVAENVYGNPSSKHTAGFDAMDVINKAKEQISNKLHCDVNGLFFTSGATMSNNVLIQGLIRKHPETMLIISSVEHNDIMALYNWLPYQKRIVQVNTDGSVDMNQLESLIKLCEELGTFCLVSIQMANSETGIIQPFHKISEIVHKYDKAFLHTDATQYVPYYPIDCEKLGIDALSMSGQKINGLKGTGILYCNKKLLGEISPIIFGEQGLIGGTHPTPMIASLGEAFELLEYQNDEVRDKRDFLLSQLTELGGILVGPKDNRLPNNIYIRFPGVHGLTLMNLLNSYDIYIGTGSACSTDSDIPSHVAMAYGLSDSESLECVRFTLSDDVTYDELKYVVNILKNILSLL